VKKKIFLFLLFIPYILFAQEYIYKEFGLNEGLPSMQAYDMYQDKNGIIWFATDRGIANYNGYEIKQFGIKEGLLSNVVLGFFPQPDGKIYCSTFDRTLFYFEEDFKGFIPYKYNSVLSQSLLPNQIVQHLYLGEKGDLHVSTHYKIGKLVIDGKGAIVENVNYPFVKTWYAVYEKYGNTLFYYLSANVSNLKGNARSIPCRQQVIEFIKLPNCDYTVFRNESEVLVLDKDAEIVTTIKNKFRPIVVKAINNSTFFIGYLFGGGKIVDIKGNVLETFLKDQSITNFLIDREGGYWFTTLYSGVFYIKDPKIRIFNQNNIDIPIYSLTKNNKNELFAGYDNGRILKIDTNNNSGIYFNSNDKLRSFLEHDTYSDNFLFYSYSDNTFVTKKTRQILTISEAPYILKFSEPAEKGMLVAHMGGVRIVDMSGNKPDKVVKVPFRVQDACYLENDIYLASPQGVYAYTTSGKLIDLKQKNKLFSYRVDDIDYNKSRNELYLASLGKGLIVYDKDTEKVYTITKKDGLWSDIINEVYIEDENEVWVCTNSGLNRLIFNNDGKFILTGLKSSDGLLNDGISDVEIINNTVWIASKKGLVYVPKKLFNAGRNNTDYLLRIKKVLVNEIETSIESLNDLSHNENRIELNFEGVSFKSDGNLVYKYKLEGLDTKWYYTKNRKVTFSSLPYGNYIFRVAVQAPGGIQRGSLLTIPITIMPPIWKTAWFIALSVISILGIIYFFFKLRVLSYNKDITRELLRVLVKKIKSKDRYFVFKEAGKDIRVKTDTILYIKSSGNYIELITENKTYIVRCKIGKFIGSTPDPLEYLRIHRSYIIRIDKVEAKSKTEVLIKGEKLPVSDSYAAELDKLIF
jgi:ligand-binding sensor domain-containing protein